MPLLKTSQTGKIYLFGIGYQMFKDQIPLILSCSPFKILIVCARRGKTILHSIRRRLVIYFVRDH